ncbi:hypothetical protein Tco_0458005 [Tanacetum coccineum]
MVPVAQLSWLHMVLHLSSFASFFTWILLDWFRLPASVYCLTEYVCLMSESAEPAEHASVVCCETDVVCLNLLSESAV